MRIKAVTNQNNRKPIKKLKHTSGKFRGDMKVAKDGKTRPRKMVKQAITKPQFLANLGKVCQPIKTEPQSDSEKT